MMPIQNYPKKNFKFKKTANIPGRHKLELMDRHPLEAERVRLQEQCRPVLQQIKKPIKTGIQIITIDKVYIQIRYTHIPETPAFKNTWWCRHTIRKNTETYEHYNNDSITKTGF